MEQYFKANTQLVARCIFFEKTGKTKFEDFSKYYGEPIKKRLFK